MTLSGGPIAPSSAALGTTTLSEAQEELDSNKRKLLAERLANLPGNERGKLQKRAATLRKLSQRKPNRKSYDEEDVKRPKESLEDLMLKLLAEEEEVAAPREGAVLVEGAVVWTGLKECRVRTVSDRPYMLNGHQLAVGDQVLVDDDIGGVVRVLPRRTTLSRPDPDNPNLEKVIVANVDIIVVVVSVKTPPLHPRLIDRYMIAIQKGGAEMLLCVNKLDLLTTDGEREEELSKLVPYAELDIPILSCSTATGEGVDVLQEMLSGKTCAFVGHSGVGKSSLLNAISPELALAARAVSEGYGRGTHTTTASSLYDLPYGTRLIDTPGIRSFGLWDMSASELAMYFPEFDGYRCKFTDCSHTHEPGCSVKEAVGADVSSARYDTYLRLLRAM